MSLIGSCWISSNNLAQRDRSYLVSCLFFSYFSMFFRTVLNCGVGSLIIFLVEYGQNQFESIGLDECHDHLINLEKLSWAL